LSNHKNRIISFRPLKPIKLAAMSAFVVIYNRSNTPAQPGVLDCVMDRLEHRGPDGSDVQSFGYVQMGHWHFWTTPEEVGERQPLSLIGLPFTIVFDGRIDNRTEVLNDLSFSPESKLLSDAALVLHAYNRWGENCFEHFVGEFALVIFDQHRRRLVCARDALGDRTLFYTLNSTHVIIASEPWAVASVFGSSPILDNVGLAHYFAMKTPEDGRTLFKDIWELMPAQVLAVNQFEEHRWRYWRPDPSTKIRYQSDKEYADHFLYLLDESVKCRMRSVAPVGVLMSGGLDSTSVACLAARKIAPHPLTTFSYVFEELESCDERKYIELVQKQWNVKSIQIPCDDAWPYKGIQDWHLNPNMPEGNPYRLLKNRAYQRTRNEGVQVLLTGGFGDQLYARGGDWLSDLIDDAKFSEAARDLYHQIRSAGLLWVLRAGFLQRAARRMFNRLPGVNYLNRRYVIPDWLTEYPVGYLLSNEANIDPAIQYYSTVLGIRNATSSSMEIFHASRHGIELRHPYRDRRLVEYMLAIPAYQLYKKRYKHILRSALNGILPELIRNRAAPTSLAELFFRGIERERFFLRSFFQRSEASWSKFVYSEWLLKHWDIFDNHRTDSKSIMIPWLCVTYEFWYNYHYS